uniref:Phytanoyl-CoA dioxygenase n=1 Tax=Entomoneis paludosa TaxID=265537 RepID=A0A7S2YCN4_9STRA|mmetsp:Transcript_26709/g.55931  ORF Transcript_26709/g.55931 Transcript_26709/m.55931 type:complete len:366 (+) Transcript_26709:191-1288(+)
MEGSTASNETTTTLTAEQIDTFCRDGVLVVNGLLSHTQLQSARAGLSSTLARYGIDDENLPETGKEISKLSSTNGSGGVLDIFFEQWKFEIATNETLLRWTQQLWEAAYSEHNSKEEAWKCHPFGPFDSTKGYAYVDRIGYRLPSTLAEELGEIPKKGKKRKLPLQRGLTPHFDCCPDTYNDLQNKTKWRPIQCFVALTDDLEKDHGGFEAAKGFHREFHEWTKSRPHSVVQKKGTTVTFPAPCLGEYSHIRPKEDEHVMERVQHVAVRAGSAVFWDNRIPHANAYRHEGTRPRAVVYCSFLPDVPINKIYVEEQLEKWKEGKTPTDQWVNDKEKLPIGFPFDEALNELSPLQRKLLGIDCWNES